MRKLISAICLMCCMLLLPACRGIPAIPPGSDGSDASAPAASSDVSEAPAQDDDPPVNPCLERAEEILAGMSVGEKVGQMFLAACPNQGAVQDVETYHLGGYLLYSGDFEGKTREQVIADIQSYQDAAAIPMLIAVDEEGGVCNRVSQYAELAPAPFSSPQKLYAEGGLERVADDAREKSRLLSSLGINLNLAPVCDVSTDPSDFMYSRTLGLGAEETAGYIGAVVGAMVEEGMGSALKHFPGYGSAGDTHTGLAYDYREYEEFAGSDFLPFIAGIDAGAGCVLMSHCIVTDMDPDYPASLSAEIHRILREELGFEGVIMTDDLSMQAIGQFTGDENAAVCAVLAGNDLLCSAYYTTQHAAVLEAVQNGTISEERIDESVTRILLWKLSLGIIE